MARGRKPGRPKSRLEVRIDSDLLNRFNAHFIDSFTGEMTTGPRSQAVEGLIRKFCDSMEKTNVTQD